MPDEEHIYILVIDRQGKEYFRARGPYSQEAEAYLRQTLLLLFPKSECIRMKNYACKKVVDDIHHNIAGFFRI